MLFYVFQLKIQFDDALTSTYEYPSEASLLDDQSLTSWTSTSTSESNDNLKSETDSVISHSSNSNSNSSLSTLKSNLAFGGSTGNYIKQLNK